MTDRLYMAVPGANQWTCRLAALDATEIARLRAPKLSGASAERLEPIWGPGWFGVRWMDKQVWFQEHGIRAFTMRSLAGKTIPMWIDDPTGRERRENPKAQTRVTASGKTQVLIFRRAAKLGQRRMVYRNGRRVDVPASYPGAPGRIMLREAPSPYTRAGAVGGQVSRHNVGVRWRHPGLAPRNFIQGALVEAAQFHGLAVGAVYADDTTPTWVSRAA